MTFRAYIDNIKANRQDSRRFQAACREERLLKPGVKATQITDGLQSDFDLGLGHARAIYATLKPHMGKG